MIVNQIGKIFLTILHQRPQKRDIYVFQPLFPLLMKKSSKAKSNIEFTRLLIDWDKSLNRREMPWKGEKDPYKIWLSEIILQQTRVEQGQKYYNQFITQFPDIHHLASAPDEKIFKAWEGLGYYSRCRNLITTARFISGELKGNFPRDYDSIRALKGVGPYTAAAISSFAFNLPYAVLDGNVYRLLARVFGIEEPINTATAKKLFSSLASDLLDKKMPGRYNQAIMDFGAQVCKPAPACSQCVFNRSCLAFLQGATNEIPVKNKKPSVRKRYFNYLVFHHKKKIAIRKREEKDIWQDLYEFPLYESATLLTLNEVVEKLSLDHVINKNEVIVESSVFTQQLTHQLIKGKFYQINLSCIPVDQEQWTWVRPDALQVYSFPKVIRQYMESGLISQL